MRRIDEALEQFLEEFADEFEVTAEERENAKFRRGVQFAIISFACPDSFNVGPKISDPDCSTRCVDCWKKVCPSKKELHEIRSFKRCILWKL